MSIDFAKVRQGSIRWLIIEFLNNARPGTTGTEKMICLVVKDVFGDSTQAEIRKEMDYLETRQILKIKSRHDHVWRATLTREGIDIAEYTVDVQPGIARPDKWV